MKNYKLVLFDLDGTTADTDLPLVLTWFDLYKEFKPGEYPTINQLIQYSGPPIKPNLVDIFGEDKLEETFKFFVDKSTNYCIECAQEFPHTTELFEKLKNRGVKLGIVTSKHRYPADLVTNALGFSKFMDVTITHNDVKNPKPNPEPILLAISKFPNIKKEDVLYVGDNESDFIAADNAGVDSMIVTFGPRRVPNVNATYFIDDFSRFDEVIANGKN